MPTNNPAFGLSSVPLPKRACKTPPGCHVAEADGPATAAATGAPTAVGPEPPALIALAVGRTATRAATPAALRDSAAAGREPDTPTDDRTGV